METLVHDVRFAARQLRRAPGFTAAAVLTLALGIGANVAIFQWMHWLMFQPLGGVDATDLYYLRWRTPDGRGNSTSWPTYLDLRQRNQTLAGLAVGRMTAFSIGDASQTARPERTFGMLVSSNFFDTLGVRPLHGRVFRPEEDERPGAHPVVVISHSLWRTRYQSDPAVIGREIRLNTHPFSIAGVMPEGFTGSTVGLRHDVWVPATMAGPMLGRAEALSARGERWLEAYMRLKPGVTLARAEQDLTAISAALTREIYKSDRYARPDIVPIWRHGAGQVLAPLLTVMMGVVAVVLLIACANVGNLLLARAAGRRREIAVRLAIGVTRARLIRQMLVESGLLAGAGALLALLTAPFTAGMLRRFAPDTDIPIGMEISTGWQAFAFALLAAAATVVLFGLAPALRASRSDAIRAMKEESGGAMSGARMRNVLAAAQVALSLLLLVGAGLLLRSLRHAVAADPGFDPRNVLVVTLDLLPNGYPAARATQFVQETLRRIGQLPGVAAVSTTRRVPLGFTGSSSTNVAVDGYTPALNEDMTTFVHTVGPDFFRVMGTRVVAGRDVEPTDDATRPQVAVINETMAKRFFRGRDPVGGTLRIGNDKRTIAGVVRDSKYLSLDEPPSPAFWLPVLQSPVSETNFLVRVNGDPLAFARAVEGAIREVDSTIAVNGSRSLDTSISAAYLPQRMGGSLLAVFGGLALVLASIGLYGVLAYSVSMRSREMGIRAALGATPAAIQRLILGGGVRIAATGSVIGLALVIGLSRFLAQAKLLFGVSPTDATTLGGISAALMLVALAASYVPARRASRVDPVRVIRMD